MANQTTTSIFFRHYIHRYVFQCAKIDLDLIFKHILFHKHKY